MRRSAGGDGELRRVYRAHVDAVYAYFAYSVDRAGAEDLTSSTFERVIRSWSSYDASRASERTWILTIARNLLTDHFRRQALRSAISTDEHPRLLESLVTRDREEVDGGELRSWLVRLSEREREILALHFAADLPASEIAALLDLTPSNVHQIISRSVRKLRGFAEAAEASTGSR